LRFVENIAAALAMLHANHCLYRGSSVDVEREFFLKISSLFFIDLKPDNVLVASLLLTAEVINSFNLT
jgi:hypothetical protein